MISYDLIGRFTVAVGIAVVFEAIAVAVLLVLALGWVKFWKQVTEIMWKGYDPLDEAPPSPRREIALVAWGLSRFKGPRKIHDVVRQAHELEEE